MKKTILFILFALLKICSYFVFAEQTIPLPELAKPTLVMVEQNQVLIADPPHVYVYSLGEFNLIAKIGKKGEGPGEFTGGLRFQPDPKYIIIGSRMKVSYYTRDGKLVKEVKSKTSSVANVYKPLGNNYAAYGRAREKGTFYNTVTIHDPDLKNIKEVIRWKNPLQPGKKVEPVDSDLQGGEFRIFEKKIFVLLRKEGNVEVFDDNGEKLYSIKPNYQRVKFTFNDKKQFNEFYRTDPRYRGFYERAQQFIEYPRYFPCAREFFVTDGKIYILTNMKKEGKSQFLICDTDGKNERSVFVPFYNKNPREFYPFYIKKGKLYQLADNEITEEWELHSHEVE